MESQSHVYKFAVDALTDDERAAALRKLMTALPNVVRFDANVPKRVIRIISTEALDVTALKAQLAEHKFHLRQVSLPDESVLTSRDVKAERSDEPCAMQVAIDGMTCHSCELTIERKWRKIAGVKKVDVNAAAGTASLLVKGEKPSLEALQDALGEGKYMVRRGGASGFGTNSGRPSFLRLLGLFALVLLIGRIFAQFGLLKPNVAFGDAMSVGAIFVIGLVAASSSCIAVTGGLLLSVAAKFNERYGGATTSGRMRPVLLFVVGRVLGYMVLGGLLGVVGKALTPSTGVTAAITILAAFYMLIMGLDMLHIAPAFLKRLMPRMPKKIAHRIMDADGKTSPTAPLMFGAATFFLPCGFTQALQLYALTTGSFADGALALGAFALGTAPALLGLGYASSALKGKAGSFFYQFSGALVIMLGLWNIQNGLAVAGYPVSLPKLSFSGITNAAAIEQSDPNVTIKNGVQVVKMSVSPGGYSPSRFTVRAGKPVRWEVDGTNAGGCISVLVSRPLGVQKLLARGPNVIEFTPKTPGEVPFSCSMGMYRGSFTVLPEA
ncbi:MAG: sulfite exporter TauE/SafE family protein [Candidatus Magasanikbacteria bacterium]|nr:sulfite exporter TauE/SafE family protein [Candidatus Magasanikbacteria bacterium]